MARYWRDGEPLPTLEIALNYRNSDEIKELASFFCDKPPLRKDERIAVITRALAGDGLRRMWETMEPLAQMAVSEVVHEGIDTLDERRFVSKHGALPRRYYRDWNDRSKNLPWTLFDVVMLKNTMPLDLVDRFRQFVPPPPEAQLKTTDVLPSAMATEHPSWDRAEKPDSESPLAVSQTDGAALQDLPAVLRLIDAGKVTASATTGRVSSAGAKTILGVLRDGDFVSHERVDKAENCMRAFAWPLIVQSAALARVSGNKMELTRNGKAALERPAHEVVKSAWERWVKNGLLDEFNRIDSIKGQNRKGAGGLTAVAPRRVCVAEALSLCPAGKWIDIDEFFRFMVASGRDFEVTRNPWNLYISEAQYGSLGYEGFHDWSMVQGRYVMALLWEYAGTLGLVDVAHVDSEYARNDFRNNWGVDELTSLSRYDGLKYFRVNGLGAYCLGLSESYTPAPPDVRPVLQTLATHEIVITDAARFTAADALFLERFCVKSGEYAWTIDQTRLLSAIEKGVRLKELRQFLDARGSSPVPGNVAHTLEDTARRAALVAYEGPAEVFRAADEATALLVLHDPGAKPLCFAGHGNRLIVPSGKSAAFRRAIRELGFVAPPEAK